MITLTDNEQLQLNSQFAGFTIDESKNTVPEGADAGIVTNVLGSGRTAHLYYDYAADHVYVFRVE
jgi:hypothetical protein